MIVAVCVLTGLGAAMLVTDQETQARVVELVPVERGFGASLRTDQAIYRSGEPIRITFEVFNHTPKPVRFDFNTAQRYDVTIEDRQGKEVWRWSAGRAFAMFLGQETVGPDNPLLIFEAEFTGTLAPGSYRIKALLTDRNREVAARMGLEVR